MSKKIKSAVLAVVAAALCIGAAELFFAPPVEAGPTCWQVDCNTCCRVKGGGVVCTQRACV